MMRKLAKLRKDQAGYALVWVLVLLIVSGLLLIPLLLLMTTGLTSSDIREESTQRFYAADAGIEDGSYKILYSDPYLPAVGYTYSYPLAVEINGSTVAVEIYGVEEGTYKITSTATDNGSGKTTTIESYVSASDFTLFFGSAITSLGDVNLQPGTTVDGDVICGGSLTGGGTVTGDVTEGAEIGYWPTAEQFSEFFLGDVGGLAPFPDAAIDIDDIEESEGIRGIGPLYRQGSLEIVSSENDLLATLGGTVYVTGDLEVGQTNKDFTIDLNGKTIFVEGSITFGGKCAITGLGAIIAVGDVDFQPHMSSDEDDFVLVMSVEGIVNFQPLDDFYGAVAGDVAVNLQPNVDLMFPGTGGDGLNFPGGALKVRTYTIE